ncbi:transferrin-binding protein-like solute binding protein [Phyllobacterium sp. YR531]|uniref:transferrin-binding protein-like solute binding protein n=1 Tax=Phyllobacterium sp. YR531 TaxID=1144343 RepID=UPI00026F5AE5|nr:transferrin-binding protein-like solute binding protein [Phyllobacterium sp. YR531]EJN05629.1 Transferrin binding protein-like solute binding protein [Phyllobacterium sp. YR531]
MAVKLLFVAGLCATLVGCGHSSEKTVSTSSAGSEPVSVQPTVAKPESTKSVAEYDLKGHGFVTGADGKLVAVNVGAKVSGLSETESAMFKGNTPLVKLAYSGDKPFTGTTTGTRRDSGEDYGPYGNDTRFLMSDTSINSKDAPTAFGVFRDQSSKDKFNAAAYYGGVNATNVPTSGQASYRGKFAGGINESGVVGGEQRHVSGKFNLAADFGAGTVKGTVSELNATHRDPIIAAGNLNATDLTFDGTIAKDKPTYSADKVTFEGETLAANVEGGFYNANASETAGIISATTDAEDTSTIIGTFHGEKQP